jgi:hypothetical protein
VDREPMSDLVERVARALFQHADGRLGPWPDLETRDSYWSEAEAALRAILETHAREASEEVIGAVSTDPDFYSDAIADQYRACVAAAPDPLDDS